MPERLGADGVNLLNSCGRAAWQTVFHFHLHVIPRYEADPLRLPVDAGARRPGRDRRGGARPGGLSVRRLALAALVLALAYPPRTRTGQVEAIEPTFQLDAKGTSAARWTSSAWR